jgi:hypothetical protein
MTLTQKEKIHVAMQRKHLTLWQCAQKIGMCPTSLFNRINGYLKFKPDEMMKLENLLEEKFA